MNALQTNGCPSRFALDDDAIHGGGRAAPSHAAGCTRCEARRAERAAAQAHFDDAIAAPLWTSIAARAAERRRQRRRFAFVRLPAVIGALGAVAVLVAVATPPAGYVAPKGRAPVEIICRRNGTVAVLAPEDAVEPGDELRFRPRSVRADSRFIQIGSVDGTGRYTPFYPSQPGAPSVPMPGNGQALAGAIRIDDAPGPERLFVVLSAIPLSEAAVRRVAESGAALGTTVDRIDGVSVTTGWIALRKRAREAPPQ